MSLDDFHYRLLLRKESLWKKKLLSLSKRQKVKLAKQTEVVTLKNEKWTNDARIEFWTFVHHFHQKIQEGIDRINETENQTPKTVEKTVNRAEKIAKGRNVDSERLSYFDIYFSPRLRILFSREKGALRVSFVLSDSVEGCGDRMAITSLQLFASEENAVNIGRFATEINRDFATLCEQISKDAAKIEKINELSKVGIEAVLTVLLEEHGWNGSVKTFSNTCVELRVRASPLRQIKLCINPLEFKSPPENLAVAVETLLALYKKTPALKIERKKNRLNAWRTDGESVELDEKTQTVLIGRGFWTELI